MTKKCLHCKNILELNQVDFCCAGCKQAFTIINDNGFKDYYSSRIIDTKERLLKPDSALDFTVEEFITFDANNNCEVNLIIQGLHCGACVWLIENLLRKQQSVIDARINLTQKTLKIKWRGDKNYGNNLVKLISEIGYKIMPFDLEAIQKNNHNAESKIFNYLAVAGFGVGNVMLFSFALWFDNGFEINGATRQFLHLLSLIIALPVLIYSGKIFFISAFKSIRRGLPNMDIAISIAIFLASIVSIVQTFRGQKNVYFDSALMLIFFLLIGRYLDFKARKKAFDIASEFSLLQASYGRVEIDNKICILPIKKLCEDMILIVTAGEKIACDGIVIDGTSKIDNSLISGESSLEKVAKNSLVFGGSINMESPLKIKITKTANKGIIAEIIALTSNAESKKNFYIRLSDRFSKYYTPIVHLLALITFILWYFYFKSPWDLALMNATAVLIITCPCALALAIPIVQTMAISNFLKKGIIVKNGAVLESINEVSVVIFDKTGSLTKGSPQLQNIYQIIDNKFIKLSNYEDNSYLNIAINLAKFSKHPLSQSLGNFAPNKSNDEIIFTNLKEFAGQGLEAFLNDKIIRLGSANLCEINNDLTSTNIDELFDKNHSISKCFLQWDNQKFMFTFKDEIKQDATKVINFLKKLNKKIILLSGDRADEVARIAKICNISEYYWQKNPIQKVAILQELQAQNIKFMMIGDGLNDAPALALSNVSLSFSKAVDISQNIADIIINSAQLSPIINIFNYSKKALLIMRQNLLLALIYNLIAVPFAICGFIVPLFAAIAMSSSSLLVMLNSFKMNSKNNFKL